jgi:hypothetical protein
MARPDATAGAALEQNQTILPVYFVFMDFLDDPLRANTSGRDVELAGTGQPDLDGDYFGIATNLVSISPVRMGRGGSQPVTARLSGLPDINDELLAGINNKSVWQGRTARLWQAIRNADREQQGAIRHYYTGYMVNVSVRGDRGSQIIEMTIESYLASFSAPSGRSYLDAEEFDPGDMSARASIAIANGVSGNPLISGTGTPGLGGGGGDYGGGGGGRSPNYHVNLV